MQNFKVTNLNATGRILSGGVDISTLFGNSSNNITNVAVMGTAITANSAVGGISVNTTFAANTPLSAIIQRMLVAAIPAVYTYPTISISITPTSYEIGTLISPTIVSTWTQNDAGSITSYKFLSSGDGTSYSLVSTSNSVPNSYTSPSFNILNTVYFKTSASYAQGQIKTDNYGQNSGSAITAGASASNVISISTFRNVFYTSDNTVSTILSSSTNIRALTGVSRALLSNGQQISNNIASGQTRIAFAYPLNYQIYQINLPGVGNLYNTLNNNTITNYFNVSAGVSVTGANGLSPTAYRVFQLKNSAPGSGSIAFYTNYNQTTGNPNASDPSNNLSVLSTSISTTNDAGAPITATLQSSYIQNGGGNQTSVSFLSSSTSGGTYVNMGTVNTSTSPYSFTTPSFNISTSSSTIYFKLSTTYAAGSQLYTDYNDPYSTPVASGSVLLASPIAVSTTGQFRAYFGATTNTTIQIPASDILNGANGTRIISNSLVSSRPTGLYTWPALTNEFWFFTFPASLDNGVGGTAVSDQFDNPFTFSSNYIYTYTFTNSYGASATYVMYRLGPTAANVTNYKLKLS